MKLTERDESIIRFCQSGATLEQLAKVFFPSDVVECGYSYKNASRRIGILVDARFLKEGINPTLGKKVFYTKKMPSFHSLIIADIKLALGEQNIQFAAPEYWIGKARVDLAVLLKTKKLLLFEIDIFKRTTQNKIDYLNKLLAQDKKTADIWVVGVGKSRRAYKGAWTAKIEDLGRSLTP
jgi:hypothetical protein